MHPLRTGSSRSRVVRSASRWLVAAWLALAPLAALRGGLPPIPDASQPRDTELDGSTLRQQIEEDWLRQAEAITDGLRGAVSTPIRCARRV